MKNTSEYLVTVSAIVVVSDELQLNDLSLCLMSEDKYGIDMIVISNHDIEDNFEVLEYTNINLDGIHTTQEWLTKKLIGQFDENDNYIKID